MKEWEILQGDCRSSMNLLIPSKSVQCCVTSPPYFGLRDYGVEGQIGLEPTPAEYVAQMVEVFRAVREVLTDDGVLWLNLGDSYATTSTYAAPRTSGGEFGRVEGLRQPKPAIPQGLKPKDLIGIPWRVAFALQADGWYLRQDIIWHKPNPMPESVTDRCTKAHEYLFLLTKSERYFWNSEAMQEPIQTNPKENYPARAKVTGRGQQGAASARGGDRDKSGGFPPRKSGNKQRKPATERDYPREGVAGSVPWEGFTRNKRSVWTVATKPYKGAHFATFPPALIEPCVLAGSRPDDVVLDPFAGSGTTGAVALSHGRRFVGCELNPTYIGLAEERIAKALGDRLW